MQTMINSPADLNQDKPMFPISVIADFLNVSQRTLRIYDEQNILVPGRSPKNRRLYSLNELERGKFIQYLTRDLGINLIGVKVIFSFLESEKVQPSDYRSVIDSIIQGLNITPEMQLENRERLSTRGRKANNN